MSKPKQAASTPANVVTVFRGNHLEPILRNILQLLDASAQLHEGGHMEAHRYARIARNELHDLLCEVVS